MNKEEFLAQLRTALNGNIDSALVQENMEYYNNYIMEEMQNGKSEQEVLQMLGEPWILARTIIDAHDGTNQETVYEAGGDTASYARQERKEKVENGIAGLLRMDTWWKKLLVILVAVMVVLLVFSIVTGLVRLVMPFLLPVIVVALLIRLIGGRQS